MTKIELLRLLTMNMMDSVRKRDKTDTEIFLEEYSYYNGQFRAYESIISMLTTVDIEEIEASDARNFMCV